MARRLAIAIMLAAATLAAAGWIAWSEPRNLQSGGTALVVRDGTATWSLQRASALGLAWWCAERGSALTTPTADIGEAPLEWDSQSPQGWTMLSREAARTALLELGWPRPWMAWRFTMHRVETIFPPSPEVSDEVIVLRDAWARAMNGEGDLTFANDWASWPIVLLTTTTVAWFAILETLSRRGAVEARGTRTGTAQRQVPSSPPST